MKKILIVLALLTTKECFGAAGGGLSGTPLGPTPPGTVSQTTVVNALTGATNLSLSVPLQLKDPTDASITLSVGTNAADSTSEKIVRTYVNDVKLLNSVAVGPNGIAQPNPNSLPNGATVNSYLALGGGNLSGANGLPTTGGSIWGKEPVVPIQFTTYWLCQTGLFSYASEVFITNHVYYYKTSGLAAAVAPFGPRFYVDIDGGWQKTNVATTTSTIDQNFPRDSSGRLQYNPNLIAGFGNVTNLFNFIHTNGFFVQLLDYGVTFYSNPSTGVYVQPSQDSIKNVSSITRSVNTATVTCPSHGFVNNQYITIIGANETQYNGTYQIAVVDPSTFTYTVSGSPATPATGTIIARSSVDFQIQRASTPHDIPLDVQTFYEWGVDSIRMGDMDNGAGLGQNTTIGYQNQLSRLWNDAISGPLSYPWAYKYFGSNAMTFWMFQTVTQDPRDPAAFEMNVMEDDQGSLNPNDARDCAQAMYQARWTYTNQIRMPGRGHYFSSVYPRDIFTTTENTRSFFMMGAMFPAVWRLGGTDTPYSANLMGVLTNQTMLPVYFDKWSLPAFRVYDLGSNNISCWAKPLSDPPGAFAIALVNQTAGSTTLTCAVSQVKSDAKWVPIGIGGQPFQMWSNVIYDCYDIWAGTLTTSMSDLAPISIAGVGANTAKWLKCIPRMSWASDSSQTLLRTTNRVDVYGTSAGITLADRGNSGFGGAQIYVNSATFRLTDFNANDALTYVTSGSTPDVTVVNSLFYKRKAVAKTSNYSVLTTDTGTCFNNNGAGGTQTNTLPAAAVGLHYEFTQIAAQNMTIRATGSDTIRNVGQVSSAGGGVFFNTVGTHVPLYCPVAGQWIITHTNNPVTSF